ncbi:carotenoid cleavage dioxygenase 7, chloroplastic [Silene latifolia]|uniref:carotenoid cleavage dioxygenase 7, chloroplastic n=1 Tax=Silene latifolia TaxID=37657 RepID=UPI003D77926B
MHAIFHHIVPPINFHPCKNLQPPPNSVRFRPYATTSRHAPISNPESRSSKLEVDNEEVAFWDYQFLFMSQRFEVPNPIKLKLIDGALPKDFPNGTYYLIGPGLFIDDYGSSINPLDGHGYLRAFEINGPNNEVNFSAKYVKTKAQIEECDPKNGSWEFTHRGPFSVLKGGKMIANTKVMKNVANTSILKWGGRLFCLWEGGSPYEIDPITLDTIGNFDLIDYCDGENEEVSGFNRCCVWDFVAHLLKPILHGVFKMPTKRMLSHYKIDAQRGRLIVMTCNAEDMVLPISHCTFYEFDSSFKLLHKREYIIQAHSMIHDWAITDTHYIVFPNRVKVDILGSMGAISGTRPMISTLSVDHSKPTSPIYILPRFPESKRSSHSTNDYLRRPVEIPQLWLLHVANAYEEIDNDGNLFIRIHATSCSYKWFNFQNMFGYNYQSDILKPSTMNCIDDKEKLSPQLIEVSIKMQRNDGLKLCTTTNLNKWTKSSDFPIINPQVSGYKHKYVYAASCSGSYHTMPHFPFDTIVKLNTFNKSTSTWFSGTRRFVGEPMFVSRGHSSEDDGYLLVIEYVVSRRMCNLLILDAKRIGEANVLVARFEVPKSLTFPLGFHGTWTPKE